MRNSKETEKEYFKTLLDKFTVYGALQILRRLWKGVESLKQGFLF